MRGYLKPKRTRVPGGIDMLLDPQEWLQISLLGNVATEPITAKLFQSILRKGDTVVDIGAHVGWLSLQAAREVGPEGKVVAIDPQPYNCERLISNVGLNDFLNVDVVPAAVAREEGWVWLPAQSDHDKARLTLAGKGANDTSTRFYCKVFSVDSLVSSFSLESIQLLKIDVEELEYDVLLGARKTLPRVENIIFECLPDQDRAVTDRITELLTTSGFEMSQVDGTPFDPNKPIVEHNIWAKRVR